MRWEDEDYIKVYKNPSPEFLAMSWQARGLFGEIMKVVDRAGILKCGKLKPAQALAVAVRATPAELESVLAELLEDGCVVFDKGRQCLFVPNFVAAQHARHTDRIRKLRQREAASNELRGTSASQVCETIEDVCHTESHEVTSRHPESQAVTNGHTREELSRVDVERSGVEVEAPTPSKSVSKKVVDRGLVPEDWEPKPERLEILRQELRVEPNACLAEMRLWYRKEGRMLANIQAAFELWVRKEAKAGKLPPWMPPKPPRAPELVFTPQQIAENHERLNQIVKALSADKAAE